MQFQIVPGDTDTSHPAPVIAFAHHCASVPGAGTCCSKPSKAYSNGTGAPMGGAAAAFTAAFTAFTAPGGRGSLRAAPMGC